MISRIRAGSLTTDSLSAMGLCLATSSRILGSVTVQPWKIRSPVSSSVNMAGQLSPSVPGSMPAKTSAMVASWTSELREFAPSL